MSILKEAMCDDSHVPARAYQRAPFWFRRWTLGRLHVCISLATDEIQDRMSKITIYNRLPVLRAERGLSRQDLARALGINYQTVGYLERGEYNPSLELAFRISEFFELPIEAIFSRRPFKPLSEEVYARR